MCEHCTLLLHIQLDHRIRIIHFYILQEDGDATGHLFEFQFFFAGKSGYRGYLFFIQRNENRYRRFRLADDMCIQGFVFGRYHSPLLRLYQVARGTVDGFAV